MKNSKAELLQALQEVKVIAGNAFVIDEQAMQNSGLGAKSTIITIFQAIGGYIATLAFLGLMFTLNVYKQPTVALGIGVSFIFLSLLNGRLPKLHLPDTIGVFIFMVGCFLTIYSSTIFGLEVNILIGIVMLLSIATLVLSKNKIVIFSSVLLLFGSMMAFLLENHLENGIHFVSNLSMAMALFLYYKEGDMLSHRNRLSDLIASMAYASAIAALIILQIITLPTGFGFNTSLLWISSLAPLSVCLYLVHRNSGSNWPITITTLALLAAPSYFAPAIIGSLAIVLIGFGYRNKDLMTVGILSFLFTTIKFYYDLKFTLLEKSIMMMAIGVTFLVAYVVFKKHVRKNES